MFFNLGNISTGSGKNILNPKESTLAACCVINNTLLEGKYGKNYSGTLTTDSNNVPTIKIAILKSIYSVFAMFYPPCCYSGHKGKVK